MAYSRTNILNILAQCILVLLLYPRPSYTQIKRVLVNPYVNDEKDFNNITRNQEVLTALAINEGVQFDPKTKPQIGPILHPTSNFTNLISNSHIFIDKSLLIKTILLAEEKSIMLSSPRSWGKSIGLLMLKSFLEIQVDSAGRPIEPRNQTSNYKLFKHGIISDRQKLRQPFLISKHDDLFAQFQGQRPVIYMDLFIYRYKDYRDFELIMQRRISRAFGEHIYMLKVFKEIIDEPQSTDEQRKEAQETRKKFQSFVDQKVFGEDLVDSLFFLSKVLTKHFNQTVFLLLDEYDDIVIYSMLESTSKDREAIKELYLKFLIHSLRENEFIEKSVFHGVTNIIENIPDRHINHLVPRGFVLSPYTQFYGFTESEMSAIYNHLNTPENDQTLIREWCDGYAVSSLPHSEIYDPRCVNLFLQHRNFTPDRWEHKSGAIEIMLPIFMNISTFEETWTSILTGVEYHIVVEDFEFTYETLQILANATRDAIADPCYVNKEDSLAAQATLHYLMVNGYLTWIRLRYTRGEKKAQVNRLLTLRVPNKGIVHRARSRTFSYYSELFNVSTKLLTEYSLEINREFLAFAESNQTLCERFEIAYEKFLRGYPMDVYNLTHGNPRESYWTYEKYIYKASPDSYHNFTYGRNPINYYRASLYCFFLRSLTPYRIYDTKVFAPPEYQTHIIMTKDKLGILVELQYLPYNIYQTEEDLIPKINISHASIFLNWKQFRNIEEVKLISILVHSGKNAMIKGSNIKIR